MALQRQVSQEVYDLAVDETEMFLQAIQLLEEMKARYDPLPPVFNVKYRILHQAYEIWKQG